MLQAKSQGPKWLRKVVRRCTNMESAIIFREEPAENELLVNCTITDSKNVMKTMGT